MTIKSFKQKINLCTTEHQFSEIDDIYRRILCKCESTLSDRLCDLLTNDVKANIIIDSSQSAKE
jgi:hypothetical protein